MKKLFTAIVAALFAVPSFAQYSSGGFELDKENVYFGARIGLALSGIIGDTYNVDPAKAYPYRTDISGLKPGLTLGAVIGLRLSTTSPVFLESGVYFTQSGGKKDKIKVNTGGLEVPLVVKYGFKVSDGVALLPFFGPYYYHAFGGKTKQPESFNSGSANDTEIVKQGSFEQNAAVTGGLYRNELGLKLGCGVEYNKLYLEVGFKYSLTNEAKGGPDNRYEFSAHPYGLFANFGVNF